VFEEVRRAVVRRFPYAVFYKIEPQQVVVLAVFHSRRDPKSWQARA
jgi:plasmid stabilization system protein ParE